MDYNPISRRYFLRGLSCSLALPFLPSIMRLAYPQTAPDVRYIQFMSAYGQYGNYYYPDDLGLTPMGPGGISARPLSSITGNISTIFGSEFNPYKGRMSLVRGLHVLAGSNLHNGCLGTCASGTFEDKEANGTPVFPYSLDSVISEASSIYPDPTGKQRHVNFCPAQQSYGNFSWNKINGSPQHMANTSSTDALLAKFVQLGKTQSSQDPALLRKVAVMQDVYADYKNLRDSSRISASDKARLESYIALISQMQKGLQSTAAYTCAAPTIEMEIDSAAATRNQINVLVAAMACQLTRVASIVLSVSYDPMHGLSHDPSQGDKHAAIQKALGQNVAYFLKQADTIMEPGGTLLDNSLVYWGNEYGENTNGDPHQTDHMTAMIAGGAAGKIQLGHYINYDKSGGRPFNNLMITFLNAMGLSSAQYERDGVVGFGEFNTSTIMRHQFEAWTSMTERRNPLPFLYQGPTLG